MKCIWCNVETTTNKNLVSNKVKYANKEHIFPEAVGGKKCLETGKVCEDCNRRLGDEVDQYLKTQNFMMLKQYQDSSSIIGKPVGKVRGKEDRKRKIEEIKKISGYGGGVKIQRCEENSNSLNFTNLPDGSGGDYTYNDKFSKALHKCAINILYGEYDYIFMKAKFSNLIDFVNNENNQEYHSWSYGVCYSKLFSTVHFEPFCLQQIKIKNIPQVVVLIFPCGIFIVCTKPNFMNIELLKFVGDNMPEMRHWNDEGLNFFNHYTFTFSDQRKTFGKQIKFTLIKKEIVGHANPDNDFFYLLTKCKTCGQINPTGITLGRDTILNGNQSQKIGGNRNSWNKLSIKDLQKQGLIIEKWDKESLQNVISQGVSYPIENDISKMNIANCEVKCINCSEQIEYDARDCFI